MRRPHIVQRIAETMHTMVPNAQTILYGSEARGDARPDSDIDLLILLDDTPKVSPEREHEIFGFLYDIELETGVFISPLILARKQWEERPFETLSPSTYATKASRYD